MKPFAKQSANGQLPCRPHLETLEGRWQPGTVLNNLGALLGSSLEPVSLSQLPANTDLIPARSRDLSNDFTQHLSALQNGLNYSIALTAPGRAAVAPSGTQVQNPASHLSLADQSVALNVAASRVSAGTGIQTAPVAQNGTPATFRQTTEGGKAATPIPVAAPQASAVALTITPATAVVNFASRFQVQTFHLHGDQQNGPLVVSGAWASYLGGATETRLNATAFDASGTDHPIVVAGFVADDSGLGQLVVARFTTDGSDAQVAFVSAGAGTQTIGNGVDVDPSTGDVYVAAAFQDASGTPAALLVHLSADFSTVVNSSGFLGTTDASGNGVRLGTDPSSGNLNAYLTGEIDGNLLVGAFTDLNSNPPTFINGATLIAPSNGFAIAPDSNGNVNVAGQIDDGSGSGNNDPVVIQLDPTLTTVNNGAQFASVGPKGALRGVAVDGSNNVYVTGAFVDSGTGPQALVLFAAFDSALDVPGIYGVAYTLTNNADFIGYDVKVDANGNAYNAVTDGDASSGGGNIAVFQNDPAGNQLNYDGPVFGALDDQARGISLDPSDPSSVYLAGFTNSTDFNFTDGTFQPTYGGGAFNGVVVKLSLS